MVQVGLCRAPNLCLPPNLLVPFPCSEPPGNPLETLQDGALYRLNLHEFSVYEFSVTNFQT